jgi:pyrroloquinoline-quinone synthase
MDVRGLRVELGGALEGRRLLDHPFYSRWSKGQVSVQELRAYAGQYRHFERKLPSVLIHIAAAATTKAARAQALQNLADEVGRGTSHLELFEQFAAAIDAPAEVAPSPAMERLLKSYEEATSRGAAEAFAGVWAYEVQAPGVSESKARGLRDHYGVSGEGLSFWDVHALLDQDHASWALEAIAGMVAEPTSVVRAARLAANAWWEFLDERESMATLAA